MSDTTIVIPTTTGGAKYLERLLPLLQREECPIIVVDNASQDNTHEICTKYSVNNYIRLNQNLNFSIACNIGAFNVTTRNILFLNNDIIPLDPFIDKIELDLLKYSAVGIQLRFEKDNTLQHAGIGFYTEGLDARYPYEIRDETLANREGETIAVTAACLGIRRDVFYRINGFHEGYRNGYEDVDLCLKLRENRFPIFYDGSIVMQHTHMGTEGRVKDDAFNKELYRVRWLDNSLMLSIARPHVVN